MLKERLWLRPSPELCRAEPSPPFPLADWNSQQSKWVMFGFHSYLISLSEPSLSKCLVCISRLSEILGKSWEVNTHQSTHFNSLNLELLP